MVSTCSATGETVARRRLDAELVSRRLSRSRDQAREFIESGLVVVNGVVAMKPATQVDATASIVVSDAVQPDSYVSRGAYKLIGALEQFGASGLVVTGRKALDAGASTGGFTEVLLERGAHHVCALDVGYGQLAWALRQDPRVTVIERVNVREVTADLLPYAPDLITADLSFISLSLVVPALSRVADPACDFVLMVKPQFEVGRHQVGSGGVVREPALRAQAVRKIADAGASLGLGVAGVTASGLPGPSGNVEFFLWLRKGAPPVDDHRIEEAVAEGPQ